MKVLIACEFSGIVRDAFLAKGIDAMSCDLLPTERPGPHHQGDVRPLLKERWDMVLAFPTCTYLTNAGAKHLYEGGRRWNQDGTENPMNAERVQEAKNGAEFFLECLDANAEMVAVENPVMHEMASVLTFTLHQKHTVQPWWFGDEKFKATIFRLKNLPPLKPSNKLTPPDPGTEEHKAWSWVFRCPPGPDRWKIRSRMSEGMAEAMADQWGRAIMEAEHAS